MRYQASSVRCHRRVLEVSSPCQIVPSRGEAAGVLILPHPETLSHPCVQAKPALAT